MNNLTNAIIGQSGGPTSAINASLAGVIDALVSSGKIDKIYGARYGIDGILKEQLSEIDDIFKNNKENLELLSVTPSSYLGSCRRKLGDDKEVFEKIFSVFLKYNIKYFFYIGGNDSMDTVMKLSRYADENGIDVKIIGVPKTIDNDLAVTDHTPGFGSAAKYIASVVMEITRDTYCYDLDSIVIIEIMGRNAGWLAASSALARCNGNTTPDLIYLPEVPFSIDKFLDDVKRTNSQKKKVIVAVSEGIKDKDGKYISECEAFGADTFGHSQLGGTGKFLENIVKKELGYKVRSVEVNVLQRCAAHCASKTDITESIDVGRFAAKAALSGVTGKMVCIKRLSCDPYKAEFVCEDIEKIANKEKKMPQSFISQSGNDITSEFIEYARPLIIGEISAKTENGLPRHMIFEKR